MSTFKDADLIQTTEYADEEAEFRVLDPDGRVLPGATVPALSDEAFRTMYEAMVQARAFDERAVSWQRQGRLATYAPMSGQEGAQVASTLALAEDDWVFPTYREHAVRLVAGFPLTAIIRGLMGGAVPAGVAEVEAETASESEFMTERDRDGPTVFPETIPIATHLPHATGAAMAADRQGAAAVAVAHFGDGATSEGDFHEALNFAGVYDAPTIFLCHNNQWAISVPRARQTASETLAQKAAAYGFEGVRVDGMDPLAVYSVIRSAREKALAPDGELRPTLVESVEYRFGAHTTADDPDVYRDEADVAYWRERDPIDRLEAFLRRTGRLDDERVDAIRAAVDTRIDDAIEQAEAALGASGELPATDDIDPETLFAHVYAGATPRQTAQREQLRRRSDRHGTDMWRE